MSVIYNGKEYRVEKHFFFLTLDLSSKGIKDISEIKGLKNLTKLQVLNLNNNLISEIKGLETLTNLKKLDLGNNPIYENLKNIIANKKTLSRMTWLEREKAGVNPKVWEVVANTRFKLLGPKEKFSGPKSETTNSLVVDIVVDIIKAIKEGEYETWKLILAAIILILAIYFGMCIIAAMQN